MQMIQAQPSRSRIELVTSQLHKVTVKFMIHVLGLINIDYTCTVEKLPVAGETTYGSRNETETALLAADYSIKGSGDLASNIARHLDTSALLTLGSKDVIFTEKQGNSLSLPGKTVVAVDTVGAGDTFAGYLGTMLAQGKTLKASCEIANKAAALACTKPGDQAAIPSIDELNKTKY